MSARMLYRPVITIALELCLGLVFLFGPAASFAASLASDKASDPAYSGGWTNGSNGGVNWGSPWLLTTNGVAGSTPTTHFIASSTNNNSSGDTNADGDIDTDGVAWGMLGNGETVEAQRYFDAALNDGQSFAIEMDNGVIAPGGDQAGLIVQSSDGDPRLVFTLNTNSPTYSLQGNDTGITNTDEGLRFVFEQVNSDTGNVYVTRLSDGASFTFPNVALITVPGGNADDVGAILLRNQNAGDADTNKVFFNSITILPNPNDTNLFADLSVDKIVSPDPATVSSDVTYTVTVTNNGPSDATAVTVTDALPASVTFVSAVSSLGTCTNIGGQVICDLGILTNGVTASITVVGTPTSTGEITNVAVATALNVDPNPTNNLVTNTVTVLPAAGPVLDVTPTSSDFGTLTVGASSTQTFSVANVGIGTLGVTSTVSGTGFTLLSGSPFDVAAGETSTVSVAFEPSSAGAFTGSVAFTSNGGDSTNEITGVATNVVVLVPVLNVTPANLDFGTLTTGESSTQDFSVANIGTGTLNVTSSVSGAEFSIITSSPFAVLAGETSTVSVAFTPSGVGLFTGSVVFASDGGDSTNEVTGAATNVVVITPELEVTPASRDFGTLAVGDSSTLSFSVINIGSGTLSGSAAVSGTGFALSGGSPFDVGAGETSTVAVTFSPGSAGAFTGSVVFTSNGGVSTNPVTGAATNVVVSGPVAAFTASPADGTAPLVVTFADASTGTITNRLWSFGDGDFSSSVSPTHVYTNADTFTVSLTVSGPDGSNTVMHAVVVTGVDKKSPLGDWEVKIAGADKGIAYLSFSNNATATGYGIRMKTFGLDILSGTWDLDAKGKLTGSFVESLGTLTNWVGELSGKATPEKNLSTKLATTNGVFKWKGKPATTFPDLSGTWSGQVAIAKVATIVGVQYAITMNATNTGVFDVATTATNTVIGQFIATSKDAVTAYLTVGTNQTTLSGKLKDKGAKGVSLRLKGNILNTKDKVKLDLTKQ